MSDNSNPSDRELILSGDRSLAIAKSGLVKRGLDLIQEKKKRHVRILFATGNMDAFESIIARHLRDKAGDRYDFEFVSVFRASKLLKLAQTYEFDMFFLFLNNVANTFDRDFYDFPFHVDNLSAEHSLGNLHWVCILINHLKTTYGKPVIAASVMIEWKEEEIKRAGADFYCLAPCKLDLLEAMIICLDRLP